MSQNRPHSDLLNFVTYFSDFLTLKYFYNVIIDGFLQLVFLFLEIPGINPPHKQSFSMKKKWKKNTLNEPQLIQSTGKRSHSIEYFFCLNSLKAHTSGYSFCRVIVQISIALNCGSLSIWPDHTVILSTAYGNSYHHTGSHLGEHHIGEGQ